MAYEDLGTETAGERKARHMQHALHALAARGATHGALRASVQAMRE